MEPALQITVIVFCLPLAVLGLRSMFKPEGMSQDMSLALQGAAGRNTMRGVIGGLFLACVSMLALGLATGQTVWFLAVAIFMGVVVFGRLVGILADGFDKAVVPPLAVELVIAGALISAHVVLG